MALIEARHLSLPPRLSDLSFTLEAGKILGIIGPNGSGKSTLLHSLAGLLPYQGQSLFKGQEISTLPAAQRARGIGLLPQACDSAWSLSVEDVVSLGRLPWNDRDATAIQAAMQQTGVLDFRQRKINQLSGGEQARVWLARVLAGCPQLLIADEPIASLDLHYQRSIMDSLRQYADRGNAVILAIHDFSLAARYCDTLCLLQEGRCYCHGRPSEVLTEHALSQVFRIPVHVDLSGHPPIIAAK
ncbi:MAG: ABC transporter ATP-binding protein [Sterolibacterium sp.]|jgi:iron complex transport system ATP-binding protein|nr:ABC transporter ATP-binding protein [Sterolibacterium sp.]